MLVDSGLQAVLISLGGNSSCVSATPHAEIEAETSPSASLYFHRVLMTSSRRSMGILWTTRRAKTSHATAARFAA